MRCLLLIAMMAGLNLAAPVLPTPTPEDTAGTVQKDAAIDPSKKREEALRKLFEGQRYLWKFQKYQSQAGRADAVSLAKAAFETAVELDPTLAEGYTALSELAVTHPPINLEEAIRLASLAVKADKNNFGGQRMLARLYTIKSRLKNGTLDPAAAQQAIGAWKEITRLDPRNAEAWAFLSVFAETQNRSADQIEALRKWIASAPPLDVQFFGRVLGGDASLTPEAASIKLAAALAATGSRSEAAAVLSGILADDAGNSEAVAMLGDLVESAEGESALAAAAALQQAVFANPGNTALIELLARLYGRLDRVNDGITLLNRHTNLLSKTDRKAAAVLQVTLGDLHLASDKTAEATRVFESALALRTADRSPGSGEDREFITLVVEKLVHAGKLADRPADAKEYIEKSRKLLAAGDPFPDVQMIKLLQATGARKDALALVREVRGRRPADNTLLRLEATLLTDTGEVDAAVQLIRNRKAAAALQPGSAGPGVVTITVPAVDEFSDLLFISSLYIRAGRHAAAVETANQAFAAARGNERKQIAKMALASAQHASGEHSAAEATLRAVLKEMPGIPMALNNLGYFLAERGERLDEAVDLIKQALKVDPGQASYLDSLGWTYLKLGKLDEAERFLKDAARADPDSSTILEHLGDLYNVRKDQPKANAYWTRALRTAIEPADVERLKGKLGKK